MKWQVGLYVVAVLVPLVAFVVELFAGRILKRWNALIATGAIGLSFVLSLVGLASYFGNAEGVFAHHGAHAEASEHGDAHAAADDHAAPKADDHAAPKADDHAAPAEHGSSEGHASAVPPPPLIWSGEFNWVALGGDAMPGEARSRQSNIDLVIPFGVHIDNLTVIMFSMVTFIALLVHLYSMGYMRDDPRFPRFYTYLSLFCFSMLGLIVSKNVFMIFMFWELVGVCSYLLIGFWYEDKKNTDAANKAFITNRVGDVGMLLGLGLIWAYLGTFDIDEINRSILDASGRHNVAMVDGQEVVRLIAPAGEGAEAGKPLIEPATNLPRQIPLWLLTIAGLGIFAGCCGKSAQFPLHVWLPDAMAGPTPVSALIHAATMVAAGVYLVGRFFPLFTETALVCIAYTGGITLFVAASIAMVQSDYKKVLAYSTVSQLGFMMLGLGVGGRAAGLFHLVTHAFFKALLFLGAGSVYHSVHTYDMHALGGLQKKMRGTALTMLIATLAISGVPLFSGFYSKDAILASSIHFVFQEGRYEHILLFLLPAVGAAMTAFYMFRMWFLVFGGEARGFTPEQIAAHEAERAAHASAHHDDHAPGHAHHDDHGHDHATDDHGHAAAAHSHGHGHHFDPNPALHAHESEPLMLWPLYALAVLSLVAGYPLSILPIPGFHPILESLISYGEPIAAPDLGASHLLAMGASLVIAVVGIGAGFLFYSPWKQFRKLDPAWFARRYSWLNEFLHKKWYFDELYAFLLIRPTLALARGITWFDKRIVDGIVNGSAQATAALSRFEGFFDKVAIDGLVNAVARFTFGAGEQGRRLQTGKLRDYLMFLALAVVGLFAGLIAWVMGSGGNV
ncbi:MAG: NADH-quinone oxidoreductase subunit L [Isosphaeraceae bacterium]|nr:NADH-quinone oxidoreductase subunit L [Isosphaeraceae bacterium]